MSIWHVSSAPAAITADDGGKRDPASVNARGDAVERPPARLGCAH